MRPIKAPDEALRRSLARDLGASVFDSAHAEGGGHGITRPLIILLAYLVVIRLILGILDWYRRPASELPVSRETEAQAAGVPAGVAI